MITTSLSRWLARWAPPFLLLGMGLIAWEVWVAIRDTPDWYLPAPSQVARTLWEERSSLASNTRVTLEEVMIGLVVAIIAGVLMAVAIHASTLLERAAWPLVIASQAIPVVALAPLLLIWFGHGLTPKVIMTALIAFFPITVATVDGLRSADRETLDLLRAMGASRLQRFIIVQAPGALPSFFSGLKVAVSVAVIGAVIGEFVGSESGLGYLILVSSSQSRTPLAFAALLVLTVMSIILYYTIEFIERLMVPWATKT